MFERTEIAEAIYGGGAPSKNTQQAEADHASFGRKQKGGGSTSSSKPEKGRAGKRKRHDAGHLSGVPTGAKNTCMLHGHGHYSEECKVLHVARRKFKDKEARSSNNKCGKTVNFERASEEVNTMKYHDEPIPRKKKVEKAKEETQE